MATRAWRPRFRKTLFAAGCLFVVLLVVLGPLSARWRAIYAIESAHGSYRSDWFDGKNRISFHATPLRDADLRQVKHDLEVIGDIYELDLTGTHITDDGLLHLADIKRLAHLKLNGTKIRGQGLRYLSKIAGPFAISVRDSLMTDADLGLLQDLPQVYAVEIGLSHLTKQGVDGLNQNPALGTIYLAGDDMTDEHLMSVVGLLRALNVREVMLWQTNVSKDGWQKAAKSVPNLILGKDLEYLPATFPKKEGPRDVL